MNSILNQNALSNCRQAVFSGVFLVFAVLYFRHFWIADDAYISFRHIDNLVRSHGLVFNGGERVQGYTNVLWTLVLVPIHWVTRNIWLDTFVTQFALNLLLFLAVYRQLRSATCFLAFPIVYLGSFSTWTYSASGLENPLSHLLVACLVPLTYQVAGDRCRERRLWPFFLVCAAFFLNRYDHALFVLPAVLWVLAGRFRRRRLLPALTAMIPAAVAASSWVAFSVFYYASAVPNTAYAKLGSGWTAGERLYHGYLYWSSLLNTDLLGAVVLLSLPFAFVFARTPGRLVLGGIALYLAYMTSIGGDHMIGRFFSAPIVGIALVWLLEFRRLPSAEAARVPRWALPVGAAGLGLVSLVSQPVNVLMSYEDYIYHHGGKDRMQVNETVDERSWWNAWSNPAWHSMRTFRQGYDLGVLIDDLLPKSGEVSVGYAIGYLPYYAGPGAHVVDPLGLTDPLLARIPPADNINFNHYRRDLPEGYLESLRRHENRIADPALHEFYDHLSFAISGPLFDGKRIKEAVAWGRYDPLLRDYASRQAAHRNN